VRQRRAIQDREIVVAHVPEQPKSVGDAELVRRREHRSSRFFRQFAGPHQRRVRSVRSRFSKAGEHPVDVFVPVARADVEKKRALRETEAREDRT
jgi:hypothetical protein